MKNEKYLESGEIVNTHGIKGEVKINPWADSPEFLTGFKTIYIDENPVKVQRARVHGAFVIAKLEGTDSVDAAEALRGKRIFIARADVELPDGACFLNDLIGAKVISDRDEELGTLSDILELPAQNVYVVRGKREILIPAVPEFILSCDSENGIVRVHIIEGM